MGNVCCGNDNGVDNKSRWEVVVCPEYGPRGWVMANVQQEGAVRSLLAREARVPLLLSVRTSRLIVPGESPQMFSLIIEAASVYCFSSHRGRYRECGSLFLLGPYINQVSNRAAGVDSAKMVVRMFPDGRI